MPRSWPTIAACSMITNKERLIVIECSAFLNSLMLNCSMLQLGLMLKYGRDTRRDVLEVAVANLNWPWSLQATDVRCLETQHTAQGQKL